MRRSKTDPPTCLLSGIIQSRQQEIEGLKQEMQDLKTRFVVSISATVAGTDPHFSLGLPSTASTPPNSPPKSFASKSKRNMPITLRLSKLSRMQRFSSVM